MHNMQHLRLFPTNVSIFDVEDAENLNSVIRTIPELLDNKYNYSSRNNVWDLGEKYPEIAKLKQIFLDCASLYANECYENYKYEPSYFYHSMGWSESVKPGGFSFSLHNHAKTEIVLVYYANVNETSGDLDLVDPRSTLGCISLNDDRLFNTYKFRPKNGSLVVLPGWLLHYVFPNFSDITRQVIVGNIYLKDEVKLINSPDVKEIIHINKSSLKI